MNTGPASTLRSLNLAMALQFAIGGAFLPFISILLRDRGLNDAQLAHIFLASSSTLLIFPFLWGMLADRYVSMERLFTLLNLLAGLALTLFALQSSFWGSLIAFTLFYAAFNPTLTLINALCFHHLENPAGFGAVRSWGSAGWIVPSLPVFLWLLYSGSADLAFVTPMAIALCLVMAGATFILPHTPPGGLAPASGPAPPRLPYWPAVRKLLLDANFVTLLVSFFLAAGSFSILVLYSPLLMIDLGLKRAWIGPIQAIGVICEVILFRWKPAFIRAWNYPTAILFGCMALLTRQLLFSFSSSIWLLCASYILSGLVIVFYHINVSVLINTLARAEVRATAQTLLVFFGPGLGPMFANWISGRLANHYPGTLRPIFLFSALLALLAALSIFIRRRHLSRT